MTISRPANGFWQKAFIGLASLLAAGLLTFLAVIDSKVDKQTDDITKMDGRLLVVVSKLDQIRADVSALKAAEDLKQANEDVTNSRRLRELERASPQNRQLSTPPPTFEESSR